MKKNKSNTSNLSEVTAALKWGTIGLVATGSIIGGGYYLTKHIINAAKENSEYNSSTSTNSKGKDKNQTVGAGLTPSAYAQQLNAALKATNWVGIPDTDEETVYKLLTELKTQVEFALVAKSYQNLYQIPLNKGLENDLDSDEFIKATNIVSSKPTK
ncbi:MAG: hypothetical protein U0V72_00670 [Cytophagales bacterium]